MRISDVLVLMAATALAACSSVSGENAAREIECHTVGAAGPASVCTVETPSANSFIVRHPDGGFRRFTRHDDGRVTTDGAEQPVVTQGEDGAMLLSLGGSTYRLPPDHKGE